MTTRPTHSPKPIRTASPPSHRARKGHFVAVLQETAALTVRKRDRLLAAATDFQKRAEACRRYRSTRVPVPIKSPGCRFSRWRCGARRSARALQYIAASADPRDSTCGATPPSRICSVDQRRPPAGCRARRCTRSAFVAQIRQGLRVTFRSLRHRFAERRQRVRADDPGPTRGQEVLGEERPQRLILPRLQVARRPVVEQALAGDMLARLADRDRRPQRVALPIHRPSSS